MTPGELKALRATLGCSTKELGKALGLEQETILSWEQGETFPTKRHVAMLEKLRAEGPKAFPKTSRRAEPTPMALLASPEVWTIFRKILAHAELRRAVIHLAKGYDDPGEPPT
jgi:transcriptional regulator with XRE-family HTH domain